MSIRLWKESAFPDFSGIVSVDPSTLLSPPFYYLYHLVVVWT